MAAKKSLAWLGVIGAIVLALAGLSFMALDKDNVVWRDASPFCPHCRTKTPEYAHRCPSCREEFDWVPPGDEDSPVCTFCPAPAEDDVVRERKKALGDEEAAKRVAAAIRVTPAAAAEYLRGAGRGQCGWCGGSGKDLGAADGTDVACPVCFGAKRCVFCGGDRRVRLGAEAAGRDLSRYRLFAAGAASEDASARPALRKELAGWTEGFLRAHPGQRETAELLFAPRFREHAEGAGPGRELAPVKASEVAAERFAAVLEVLRTP